MNNVSNQGKGNVPKYVENQYLKIKNLYNNYKKTKNNVNLEKTLSLLKKIENLKNMFIFLTHKNRKDIINIRKSLEDKLKTQMFSNNNTLLFNTNKNYKNIFNENFNNKNIFREKFNYTVKSNSIMKPGDFVFKANKFLYLDINRKLRRAYANANINIPENYSKYTFSIEKQLDPILELIYETPELISGGRISVRRDDELIIREFDQELPSKYKYFLESDEEGLYDHIFMFTVRTGTSLYNGIIFQVPMLLKKLNNNYSFTLKN